MVGQQSERLRRRAALAVAAALATLAVGATAAIPAAQAGEGGLSSAPAAPPVQTPAPGVASAYPIRGAHEYWAGWGDGRGHQGADVGARCGTPLVAAQAGRVRFVKSHPRAGNYLVIDVAESVFDLAYMHLAEPAPVKPGESVAAGQPVGLVGDTGNASGCHLHFELWEGAYYGGGAPIDPMPYLLSLDGERKRLKQRSLKQR
ncbi:MAG TPA: M23 family metallopeptidase [Solirubrobacterales bacterium]|nr:M23 family metallopeptidase [Solirubrobacterales bacterium]